MSWLLDRGFRIHVLALALLIGGWAASTVLKAQGQQSAPQMIEKPSLLDRWLSPDVVIGGVLVLLYMGELRGDLGRLKREQDDFRLWRNNLHDSLARDFMSREAVEARLHATAEKLTALERRIG